MILVPVDVLFALVLRCPKGPHGGERKSPLTLTRYILYFGILWLPLGTLYNLRQMTWPSSLILAKHFVV